MTRTESIARRRILDAHRETLAAVIDAGRTVAGAWRGDRTADSRAITDPLDRLLGERGLKEDLLDALETGAASIDEPIQGSPVPAPPYLAVASRGPICRGTLSDGRRLVVELVLFAVEDEPQRYRFLSPDPDECLRVHLR